MEFFILSAVVMGACLLGLPPKSLEEKKNNHMLKTVKLNAMQDFRLL